MKKDQSSTGKRPKTVIDLLLQRPRRFCLYIFACLFPIIEQLAVAYAIANILGLLQYSGPEEWRRAIILSIVLAIGGPLLQLSSRFLRIGYMRDILLDLRKLVFERIISLSYQDFSLKSKDSYISKLTADINLFEKDFFLSLLNVIFSLGLALLSLLIIFIKDPYFALLCLFLASLLLLVSRLFKKPLIKSRDLIMQENELFSIRIGNFFSGLEIIRLNQVEKQFSQAANKQFEQLEEAKLKGRFLEQLQEKALFNVGIFMSLVSIAYIVIRMVKGELDLTAAILMLQLQSHIDWPLILLFEMKNRLTAANKIFENLTAEPLPEQRTQEISSRTEDEKEPYKKVLSTKPLAGDIEIVNLSYQFKEAKDPLIRQANLTLTGGGKYLLKGASGAGKTTFLNLLSGAVRDYEGEIFYGKVSLREIDEQLFNQATATILQDVYLFAASLKENICLFQDYPPEEIERAVELAGLEELVAKLPAGLETMLTEGGYNLSGGERQRISIARAIIKRSKILLADEITSAIDAKQGAKIEQSILSLPMTVLAISHRYYEGISEQFDAVIELKQGKLNIYPAKLYFSGDISQIKAGGKSINA